MIGLTMNLLGKFGHWYFGLRQKWNALIKHYLMIHTSRSMEDSGVKSDLNCRNLTQVVSEENSSMLPRNYSCDILVKNMAAFCPCPKSLPEVKVKRLGLISLVGKKISRQSSIDSIMWLLVFTLRKM